MDIDEKGASNHALWWFALASVLGVITACAGKFLVSGDAQREVSFGIFSVAVATLAGLRGMQRFAERGGDSRSVLGMLEKFVEWSVTSSIAGPLVVGFGVGTGLTAGLIMLIPHVTG